MKSRKWGFIWRSIILITVLCIGTFSFDAKAEEGKTVRVGVYRGNGYHMVNENGTHSGYDYEYLMTIAKYTGWKYEFVEGTWPECIERLEKGEIDLLGGVEKKDGRETRMHFASSSSANSSNCLMIAGNSDTYSYEDFEAFDGMKIGTLNISSSSTSLQEYSEKNGFTYETVGFETEEEMKKALKNGQVDSVFLSDLRKLDEYKIIASFGYAPLYYVTSLERTDLQKELDEALTQIHSMEHYFESDLYGKYFSSPGQIAFTKQEKNYIEEHKVIPTVMIDGFPLICEYDKGGEKYRGIIVDVLTELSDRTGLQFEPVQIPKDEIPWNYVENNPNVIMAPCLQNNLIDYGNNMEMLNVVEPGRMVMVCKSGENIQLEEQFVLAVPEDMLGADENIRKAFPKAEIISCSNHQNGLDMVKTDKADMTLMNEIVSAYYLQSPYYANLKVINTENITENITLALAKNSDPMLISILNKAITSFSDATSRQILVDNTAARSYEMSRKEWFYQNRLAILPTMTLFVVGLIVIVTNSRRKKKAKEEKQKRQLVEERKKVDQEYREKMFYRANFDSLTGLYNKNYFIEKATELLAENPNTVYAFFRINIEKFKMINEIFGQERGDIVLIKIADILRNDIGEKGVYARIYSDHFVLCYPVDEEKLKKAAKATALFLNCAGQRIRVQLKIGVYINSQHYQNVLQLMDYAQIALQNKEKPADDNIYYYRDSYLDSLLRNQKITNEMEQALREGQFHIFLQPQFGVSDKRLVGAEALIRWFHPEDGVIPPNQFIPVFEENQFIYMLDAFVCDRVCRLLAKWINQGKIIPVSINLSRIDLQNPDLVPMLQAALRKYSIPVEYLHLEITESAYVENQEKLISVIEQLHKIGFMIEMDDFGSGYSSLNMLKDVPVDILKLDMRFFNKESHMERGGNIIESVVSLAHSLGIMVIAEGVETEREVNFLRSVNCEVVQGYLYGRPVAVEEFETLLVNCDVGEKTLELSDENGNNNLYWRTEKYNLLLRNDNAIMFDYDPSCDYAVYTAIQSDGKLQEHAIAQYCETLYENQMIHPDYRGRLGELLMRSSKGVEEVDFLADYYGTGKYEWFHTTVYSYYREGNFSRVIAIIKEKK